MSRSSSATSNARVGRRPILDDHLRTVAYELLSPVATRRGADDRMLLDALAAGELDDLTGGLPVLLRVSGHTLSAGMLDELPAARLLVDVHAVDLDLSAQRSLRQLKDRGARVVLANATPDLSEELLQLGDLVRLDSRAHRLVTEQLPAWRRRGMGVLADNVETHDAFHDLRHLGLSMFQGWFLLEPDVHETGIPHDRLSLLRLLAGVDAPDRDLDEIEQQVQAQAALSYRLLRHVNSAYMGMRHRVDDLRRAIMTVGPATLRDLVTVTMLEAVSDRPREVLRTVLVRAKLAEYLAPTLDVASGKAFLVGLFSGLEAVVGVPRAQLLADLPLAEDVRDAVLRLEGPLGSVVTLAIAYERCDWSHPLFRAQDLGELTETFLRAVGWVEQAMPGAPDAAARRAA